MYMFNRDNADRLAVLGIIICIVWIGISLLRAAL